MNVPEVMVDVRNLTRTFQTGSGKPLIAVNNVSFQIRKGEIYSLLGQKGAGKSATINMISGLLSPTSGEAYIGGYSITQQPVEAKKLLGVVPQEIAIYPSLTARQNLVFFGRMYGLDGSDLNRRVDEVLDFIDLRDRQNEKVEKFSGGMKRRVNIGIGLLHQPKLIYMDEPTVGIDPQNRRRILDTVLRLRDEMSTTILYTSHLMEEVQELSNRVAIIDHGEVIAVGTVGELIQKIGEEDRLFFNVGDQPVSEALLTRFQTEVAGVTSAKFAPPGKDGEGSSSGMITIFARRGRRALPDLLHITNEANLDVFSVEVREPDLEAVFLQMTGRVLRD